MEPDYDIQLPNEHFKEKDVRAKRRDRELKERDKYDEERPVHASSRKHLRQF